MDQRKGGRRVGAGRPQTAQTVSRKQLAIDLMAELNGLGVTPLHIFSSMMRGNESITEAQFEAAKAAAPYMHARLTSIRLEASIKHSILDFSDEDLYAIVGSGEDEGDEGVGEAD